MARTPLTLAALATAAVADLDVVAASAYGGTGGSVDSAVVTARDGRRLIIRVPRTVGSEAEQSADLVALRALSAGIRTRLPFAVPTPLGQVPVGDTRGVVYDLLPGSKTGLNTITPDLAASIGRAVAAVHGLPTSFVADAGLPSLGAIECLRAAVSIIDRATATGLVPSALIARWERGTEESTIWQFQPTVINGALSASSILSDRDQVTAVLGWQELRVGDPARDLAWLFGARGEWVAENALEAYTRVRGSIDRQVRQRATLYSELELAKWLLHGTQTRSTEIVDDAVTLLSALADRVHSDIMNPIGPATMPTATVDEVESLLQRSERAAG